MRPRTAPAAPLPPGRAAFLEALRERIRRGEYRVPADLVADAILRAWAPAGGRGEGAGTGVTAGD
jgi:hypothetical protein